MMSSRGDNLPQRWAEKDTEGGLKANAEALRLKRLLHHNVKEGFFLQKYRDVQILLASTTTLQNFGQK